jgi:hypothetical protein
VYEFICRCGARLAQDLGSPDQALDGILGFGRSNSSMLSQLANTGQVRRIFAHCLDSANGGGIFTIGNIVQPEVKTTTALAPETYVLYSHFVTLLVSSFSSSSISCTTICILFLQLLAYEFPTFL